MPLYEYLCESCQGRTEILQRIGDPPAADCPECGGTLRKLLSAPAFQFKGSGWYVTDYAGKPRSSEGSDAAGKSETGTGSSTAEPAKGGSKETPKPSSASAGDPSASGGD